MLMDDNLSKLEMIEDNIQQLFVNPEIGRVVSSVIDVRGNKNNIKETIEDFRNKVDMNLQELIELDEEIGQKMESVITKGGGNE